MEKVSMKSVQERISCLAIIRELNLSGFSAKLKDVAVWDRISKVQKWSHFRLIG